MLAEKCPNCGAFLPVRRTGVSVRACEFCGLEVPGEVVEVPRLTVRGPAVRPPTRGGRAPLIAAGVVCGALAVIGVAVLTARRAPPPRPRRAPPAAAAAEAEVEAPPPAPPPRPDTGPLAAAIAAAGGADHLDPLALLAFADARARAAAEDALLLSVQCYPVRSDGRADLTALTDARCSYEYRTPAGTRRPPDLPPGVSTDYPCSLELSVDQALTIPDVRVSRYRLDMCRAHHAVRPPRCTVAEVWARAQAAGLPADGLARVRYAGRYQSGYDPVDAADEFDHPERGRWTVSIARDGADDLRYEGWDDCGQAPPTADEARVVATVQRARGALRRCFAAAVGRAPAVEALEVIWRLAIDARGAVTIGFADPGVDIEGLFQGDLDGIRARWDACAADVARRWRLPAALREVRLELRVTASGELTLTPPPFD